MPREVPAKNLRDLFNVCHPEEPIEMGDPRFVDLTDVRGGEAAKGSVAFNRGRMTRPHHLSERIRRQ